MRLFLVPYRSEPWKFLRRRSCFLIATPPRFASNACLPARTSNDPLDLLAIDQKWQRRWEDASMADANAPARAREEAEKAYVLPMFPYPSGALHMGHLRVHTITDVLARFKKMQGYNVLHPMGWDAFGLPAENAAIERGVHPADWTLQNIAKMKEQLKAMNGDIDWSREFMTCDPSFYKHTQKLFLLLHQHGLAYQAQALVNYDPVDKTVLANEQVDSNGLSWRSGAKVQKVSLKQWFLRITAFKEALLEDLDFLGKEGKWMERVIAMQRHWLGRSEGAMVTFLISTPDHPEQSVKVFTTRPDTLFGVQYLALSVSHPLVARSVSQSPELADFIDSIPLLPPGSKAAFQLPGVFARNPLASLPSTRLELQEPLPVFVAPYVVDGYGPGAVMGVPAHDTRDFAFWHKNCTQLPIRQVIHAQPNMGIEDLSPSGGEAVTTPGYLSPFCQPFDGLHSEEASERIIAALAGLEGAAEKQSTWRLRDWLISRQRYWGTPIPMIHCRGCGIVPVPEEQLPVELPKIDGTWLKHKSGNPLESADTWVNVACPKCGEAAKRDTDTMDTFMCSSWYMFRFLDPHNESQPFGSEKADVMMPVDVYVGGIEHAILHLLYARFIAKFLATTELWPAGADPAIRGEPFRQLISQGMVHGKTYSDPQTGRFLKPEEVDLLSDPAKPRIIQSGLQPTVSFEKMSKSKYNGVDPLTVIRRWGADVTRAHILFQAPITEVLEWEEERIVGIQRWFQRIWRLVVRTAASHLVECGTSKGSQGSLPSDKVSQSTAGAADEELRQALHSTIASINTALSSTHALNTCISDLMQLTNAVTAYAAASPPSPVQQYNINHATCTLLRLLAPFAPAFSSECWERLHLHPKPASAPTQATSNPATNPARTADVFSQPFPAPSASPASTKRSRQTCTVMQNGRLRFTIEIPALPEDAAATPAGGAEEQQSALERLVLVEIGKTEVGRKWLEARAAERRSRGLKVGEGEGEDPGWKRVVVAKGGRVVNFVG